MAERIGRAPASSHGLRSDTLSSRRIIVQPPAIFKSFAFVTVCAHVAEHFDRATHAQSNHACDVSSWPERDEPDPCPCVGSQGQTGNGRGAAITTRMEQTKFIAYDLSGIEG